MKYYRLVDSRWEPYYTCYNETDLKELAYWIFSLWDSDDMWDEYWNTDEDRINKIYDRLLNWERDFIYIVEEQDQPFSEDEDPNNIVYWKYLPY